MDQLYPKESVPKEGENEESSTEDIAEGADDKVDALINLLIKKGIITEQEFDEEYDDLFEDEGNESPTSP